MNESSFRLAFMAVLAGLLSGCASPMRMFSKKQQPFEEYVAQHKTEQTRIADSQTTPGGPAEVSELLHQGHAAFQQGNLPEAQSKYSAVVQRQPNHPVANHRLGVIADRQQDYTTAQRYYFAALNASPNDPNLLNDIGYSLLLQSRYPEAENYLQGALQKNPKQSNAINNLGLLYAKQGQPDRALAMFRLTNSEAEARAKVTRLLPSGQNAAPSVGTMMANQGWSPQNPVGITPGGFHQPQQPLPNLANSGWTPPHPTPPDTSAPIAQTAAVSDPNVPAAARRIKEQMEAPRLKAVSDQQARDNAERQRQEFLKRQLRDEELGRSNIVNPVDSQPSGANRWNGTPIVIGATPNANVPNSAPWQVTPDGQRPANGAFGQLPNGQSNTMPNLVPNPIPESMPNVQRGSVPPPGFGSPLDSMPTWPPADTLPSLTPNNSAAGSSPSISSPNNGVWPNGFPPGMADDPARAASRLGMNAGSSHPFPITPGPSSGAMNAPNWPNSPNSFNNFGTPNGVSPTTSPNWPANSNPPNDEPLPGEPPAGSFGSSNFSTSANSQDQLIESPAQFALQDRLPPSGQFQTPGTFGHLPAGTTQTQPASFGAHRNSGGQAAAQFRSRNVAASDHFGDGERWENGQIPGAPSVQASTPTMPGHLATPSDENSLIEYERMIQATNAETNRIRQLLDEQRQLPPSENFRRSSTQTGTPNGAFRRR